ncbi:hypothetical protein Tco_0775567, partial [Tanacetum coccineum]
RMFGSEFITIVEPGAKLVNGMVMHKDYLLRGSYHGNNSIFILNYHGVRWQVQLGRVGPDRVAVIGLAWSDFMRRNVDQDVMLLHFVEEGHDTFYVATYNKYGLENHAYKETSLMFWRCLLRDTKRSPRFKNIPLQLEKRVYPPFGSQMVDLIPKFSPEKAQWITPSLFPPPRQLRMSRVQSCNGLLLCTGPGWPACNYVYNPSTNLFKMLPPPDYSHADSPFYTSVGLRMAFDPTKLLNYKVVHNGALHWLETKDIQYGYLKHYKLNIEDHDHPILTTIQIHQGLNRVKNFFEPLGNNLRVCITIQIPQTLHVEGKLFESRGCLLVVLRDYISSREFTIYKMRKGCSVWSVSIVLGEREEDSCLVINLSGKVVEYNLISKTLYEIYDIGSNQLDDDELIPPFASYHNVYEFIPSFASLGLVMKESSAIYLNGDLHWLKLEDIMDDLMHFKLNIEDHDHPILTSIKIHQGLHRVMYFFEPLGNNLPICITIRLEQRFYLEGKLLESRGCLLAVLRHYFGSREFTIYKMRKWCSVWSVRYLVNTDDFMNPLPEGWSIWSIVWSIVLGEREDDSCLVLNLSEKVVQYNLISKTLHEIYDIGSNQLDDNLVDDELIMPF